MPAGTPEIFANGGTLTTQVYIWEHNRLPAKAPAAVLKTGRSLRAIHFHPHGAPLLLTAEVVERRSSHQQVRPAASQQLLSLALLGMSPLVVTTLPRATKS